jgi:hypothetical protein
VTRRLKAAAVKAKDTGSDEDDNLRLEAKHMFGPLLIVIFSFCVAIVVRLGEMAQRSARPLEDELVIEIENSIPETLWSLQRSFLEEVKKLREHWLTHMHHVLGQQSNVQDRACEDGGDQEEDACQPTKVSRTNEANAGCAEEAERMQEERTLLQKERHLLAEERRNLHEERRQLQLERRILREQSVSGNRFAEIPQRDEFIEL